FLRLPPLAEYLDLVAFDQGEIDLRSQSWPVEGVDETLAVDGDVVHQPVFLRPFGQQHLEELGVPGRHDDMQIGDVVERVAAVVDLDIHVEGLGQACRLGNRGDAALDGDVGAQIVGRLLHDPGGEGIEAAGRVLGRHDRDIELLPQLDVIVDVG